MPRLGRLRRADVGELLEGLGVSPAEIAAAHDLMWAAVWARRYREIAVPVWSAEAAHAGIVVYAHRFEGDANVALIDADDACLGVVGRGAPPPVGALVSIAATASGTFMYSAVRAPGLGIRPVFDGGPAAGPGWIDALRAALSRIRELQVDRRQALDEQRRGIGYRDAPPGLEAVWREELERVRALAETETLHTHAELKGLEKARALRATGDPRKTQRGLAQEAEIVTARQRRFDERAAAGLAALRERWPEIAARHEAEQRRYHEFLATIETLENATAESRQLTDASWIATRQLDDVERSALRVAPFELPPTGWGDPALGAELIRTVDLLHRALGGKPRQPVADARRPPREP